MMLSLVPVVHATELPGETGQLTHRGLDSDGENWGPREEDLNDSIGQVSPGSEHWLVFYAGETEEPVEVEVSAGSNYVRLECLSDEQPYYYIKIAEGTDCWEQTVTLSAELGGVVYSDTFTISRDHAAFFAEPDVNSDYLSDFTLSRESDSLYLHIQTPEWLEFVEICTDWYDENANEGGPHSGWDAAWYEPVEVEGVENLFKITFNPLQTFACYGSEDFDLNLDIVYWNDETDEEEVWGTGIRILNQVNPLTHRGLDNDGEDWWPRDEALNVSISQIPAGSEHFLAFYAGDMEPSVKVEVTEGAQCVEELELLPGEDNCYYLLIAEDCWGQEITLSAEVDGKIYYDTFTLQRDHAAFFSEARDDLDYYLNQFRLTDDNTTLYLHIEAPDWLKFVDIRTDWYDEEAEEGGLHGGWDVAEYEPLNANLYKITFDPRAAFDNYGLNDFDLNLDIVYQNEEENEEVWGAGIRILNDVSALTHRGLDSDGESWWIRDEHLTERIGHVPANSEHWLAFFDTDSERPVQVEVTKGIEYATLESLPGEENYYRLVIAPDCWGQEITLTEIDGSCYDTFTIERDHAAFFADEDPDLEHYSDYLYDFTLSRESDTMYLHVQPPEWATSYEIHTDWYDEERDEGGPHSGWDSAWHEAVEGTDDLYRITFDPLYAFECHRLEDFDLNLDIVYRNDEDDHEESWGAGIRILNDVNPLTHRGLDNDGENWYIRDEERTTSIGSVPPGSEHWLVFYAGDMEHPVEVEVTKGSDYVRLERLDNEEPYYYIQVSEDLDAWGQTVTLSTEVDGEVYYDTFTLQRNHAAFFSEPGSDLNNHLNRFELTDTNTTLYLHIEKPEWAESYEIQTEWYDAESGEGDLHSGWHAAEIDYLGRDCYKITFDPQLVTIHYGRDDFGLDLTVVYTGQNDERHEWGAGIFVENHLSYLSHKNIEWDHGQEQWMIVEDGEQHLGYWINPQQEFLHVYYLNVFDQETGEWSETPVNPENIAVIYDENQSSFVTMEAFAEWCGEDPASEEAKAYGCVVTVSEDAWNQSFLLSGTVDNSTGCLLAEVRRDELSFYSSRNPGDDAFLDYFRLTDADNGNVLYLAAEFPEDAGYWISEVSIDAWYDGDGNEHHCENADLITVTEISETVYKIEIDREKVQLRHGPEGFDLQVNVILSDGENTWDNPRGIWVENNLSYLHYLWLDEQGEGWFINEQDDRNFSFSMRPGDTFFHTYFLTYYNDAGEQITEPVIPRDTSGLLILETLTELEEPIREDQELAGYFLRVTAGESTWDQTDILTAETDGHSASMKVEICRGESEFYASSLPSNDTHLREFVKDPQDTSKNTFYLGIRKDPDWNVSLENVYLQDESLATLTYLENASTGEYAIFEVTLTEKGIQIAEDFHLEVNYQWINNEDENDVHDRSCGIHVPAVQPDNFQAAFRIDGHDVEYYAIDDEGGTLAYVWEDRQADDGHWYPVQTPVADNFPIQYNYKTNTITLLLSETGDVLESLELVYQDEDDNNFLPSRDVTLVLEGENIIWNGSYDPARYPDRVSYGPALRLEGGINLTITGDEDASLLIHSENDLFDPWTHAAIDLWNNQGGSLTIADNAQVTVTVGGEGYKPDEENCLYDEENDVWISVYLKDENDDLIPAWFNAIGVDSEGGASLFVQDEAVLNVLPGDTGSRWLGLMDFQTLEVIDHATLNTGALDMAYHTDAKLLVRGDATLNVTMTNREMGEERYYLGIAVPMGSFALCDNGTVNITAPDLTVESGSVWAEGMFMKEGSFELCNGTLNIDLTGIKAADPETAEVSGVGLTLGNSEAEGLLSARQDSGMLCIESGLNMTAVQVGANATVNLSGGKLNAQAWQGIVNNGIINVRDGMTVTLEPWALDGAVQRTSDSGMFYNDVHYILRQVSALNVYGGDLNITAFGNPALNSATEYIQTGGTVILTDLAKGGDLENRTSPAACFGGRNTLSGGQMTAYGVTGILIYPETTMVQNYFRLTGTDLSVSCDVNGVLICGEPDNFASMNLMGGKLTIQQEAPRANMENSALLLENGTLTVTGGQHAINGYTGEAAGNTVGLRAYRASNAKIQGGTLIVSGHRAVVAEPTQGTGNSIVCGNGMYVHSNNEQATSVTYVASVPEGEIFEGLDRYTLRETVGGQQVDATSVTFEAGEAPVILATAQVEVTTARATVGAMVTVQANVTAENGTASFVLPEGLTLIDNSITVNNVAYDGDLSAIPVAGSAHIVFRVKPQEKGTFTIQCRVDGGSSSASAETSFPVYGFRISAPSHTTTPNITVQGSAVPGETITLTVINETTKEREIFKAKVTVLGTFVIPVELPMEDDELDEVREFTLTLDQAESLTVVYSPNSPCLDDMTIGNQIMDENDYPIWSYNHIIYQNGTGTPERSFYTYIPDMDLFRFETKFRIPSGWDIENPKVLITYQEDGQFKELELKLELLKEETGEGETIQWWYVLVDLNRLPTPPMEFQVVYTTVPPAPQEIVIVYTNTVVVYPIIDPSGTIYCGSLDNPVAGAIVTLYYGGNDDQLGKAQVFDMTSYGQVNPQITDNSGHYAWDVPTGWWKVVAEKDGVRSESEWVHVLPAHTDLHLNLDLLVVIDLLSIKPATDNGMIPAGDFQAEITLKNKDVKANAVLIVAAYTENGQFLSFQSSSISGLKAGETKTIRMNVSNPGGAKKIKAFLVKDMTTMKPLSAAVGHPITQQFL